MSTRLGGGRGSLSEAADLVSGLLGLSHLVTTATTLWQNESAIEVKAHSGGGEGHAERQLDPSDRGGALPSRVGGPQWGCYYGSAGGGAVEAPTALVICL